MTPQYQSFLNSYGLGQTTQDYLNLIMQYESMGGQNIPNYKFGPGFTAQGYYQITNQNWLKIAPQLGIDTTQYPNAMSAPQDVQTQVATYLLTQTPAGIANWANYNPQLNAALSAAGLQTSGPVSGSAPIADVSGTTATTPTPSLIDQISTQASVAGIDFSDPTTEIVLALGAAVALFLFMRK